MLACLFTIMDNLRGCIQTLLYIINDVPCSTVYLFQVCGGENDVDAAESKLNSEVMFNMKQDICVTTVHTWVMHKKTLINFL